MSTKRIPMTSPFADSRLSPGHCPRRSSQDMSGFENHREETDPATLPSLASLPNDIITNIISYLPQLSPVTTSRQLKEAYEVLSLARSNRRYAVCSLIQTRQVTKIDPFPNISHTEPSAHLPPYARPAFLRILVSLCPNLQKLRAPFVRSVLQFAGSHLRELAFIDTGLTDADLKYLSRSQLTRVMITNPSRLVLAALGDVKTLKHVSLLRICPHTVPSVLAFFDCTTTTSLFIDVDSTSDEPLLSLLHGLPSLRSFALNCEVRQLWWVLRYLRKIAVKVEKVEIIVGGVRIRVKQLDDYDRNSNVWENSIMRRLVCRKDMGANELDSIWPEGMSFTEIDFEVLEETSKCGVREAVIDDLISDYCKSDRSFEEVTVRFGRTIPSVVCAETRGQRISKTGLRAVINRLVISQDIVIFARTDREHWLHKFLLRLVCRFKTVSTMQLCRPSAERRVSARFVIALPNFLKVVVDFCPDIQCIYMENAGELVLQTAGIPILTDQEKLKELLRSVIAMVKKMEADKGVELGTVIAQLEVWARIRKFRVADGKDVAEVVVPRVF